MQQASGRQAKRAFIPSNELGLRGAPVSVGRVLDTFEGSFIMASTTVPFNKVCTLVNPLPPLPLQVLRR